MGAGLGPVGAAGGWARGERGPDSAGSVSCCPIGVWASRPALAPCPPGLAWRWQERAASRPPRASQPGLGQIPAPVFGRLSDWRSVQGGLSPVPAPHLLEHFDKEGSGRLWLKVTGLLWAKHWLYLRSRWSPRVTLEGRR